MKTTLAFYDVHQKDQEYFREVFGQDYELFQTEDGLTADNVAKEAEVLSVHVSSKVTAEIMGMMPNLKHVAARSTGFDHVDLAYCKAHNIVVTSVPSYGENTVAEYAFMLILALSRKLVPTLHAFQTGEVVVSELTGADVSGKTLGVVGTGRIGRHSIKMGKGFDMNVIGYDKFENADAARDLGFTYVPLDELLATSDIITVHCPATPETEHMINSESVKKMKKGVIFVNTARGNVVETAALIDGLTSGQVGAAGLDVIEGEEYEGVEKERSLLFEKHLGEEARAALGIDVLSKLPNVIVTTHNAFNSAEALQRIRQTSADNIKAERSGSPVNLVKL